MLDINAYKIGSFSLLVSFFYAIKKDIEKLNRSSKGIYESVKFMEIV
jgi:hypothetical protein